jgi:hypothetical protein
LSSVSELSGTVALALNRSPEAIFMKLTLLGLAIPEKSSLQNMGNKVTESATTTTPDA